MESDLPLHSKHRLKEQDFDDLDRKKKICIATLAETIMKAGKLLTVDGRSCEIGGELIKILTVHPLKMMRSLVLSENGKQLVGNKLRDEG